MKIAVGSDERTAVTDAVIEELRQRGHTLTLHGPLTDDASFWPQVAREVAEAVAQARADEGILFCWTGTGVSIAANKVRGIRAALCDDAETARGARLWNDANILCLSLRRTSEVIAKEILDAWFSTQYKPNQEDDLCLGQVAEIENQYFQTRDQVE
jgi:ribose 5-phosphate isomerase B